MNRRVALLVGVIAASPLGAPAKDQDPGADRAADVLGGRWGRGSGSGKPSTTTGVGTQEDRPSPARSIPVSEIAVGTPSRTRPSAEGGGPIADPDMARIGGLDRTRPRGPEAGAPAGSAVEHNGDRDVPGAGGRP